MMLRFLYESRLYSFTSMACVGHCVSQARQTMQESLFTGTAFASPLKSGLFCSSKTETGQTLTQVASPLHLEKSTVTFGIITPHNFWLQQSSIISYIVSLNERSLILLELILSQLFRTRELNR